MRLLGSDRRREERQACLGVPFLYGWNAAVMRDALWAGSDAPAHLRSAPPISNGTATCERAPPVATKPEHICSGVFRKTATSITTICAARAGPTHE